MASRWRIEMIHIPIEAFIFVWAIFLVLSFSLIQWIHPELQFVPPNKRIAFGILIMGLLMFSIVFGTN